MRCERAVRFPRPPVPRKLAASECDPPPLPENPLPDPSPPSPHIPRNPAMPFSRSVAPPAVGGWAPGDSRADCRADSRAFISRARVGGGEVMGVITAGHKLPRACYEGFVFALRKVRPALLLVTVALPPLRAREQSDRLAVSVVAGRAGVGENRGEARCDEDEEWDREQAVACLATIGPGSCCQRRTLAAIAVSVSWSST